MNPFIRRPRAGGRFPNRCHSPRRPLSHAPQVAVPAHPADVAFLANFSQLGARVLISPLVPAIMDSFDITKGAIGLTLSLM